MATYHSFNEAEVKALVDTAAAHHQELAAKGAEAHGALQFASPLRIGDTCISVTVENSKICVNLPIVNQKVCFPIPPFIPNGTAAQVCLKICTPWIIPTGVCVTITALGKQIVQQCFGKC